MTQPDDLYGAVIRERSASDAVDLLADECRKKDRAIALLTAIVEECLPAALIRRLRVLLAGATPAPPAAGPDPRLQPLLAAHKVLLDLLTWMPSPEALARFGEQKAFVPISRVSIDDVRAGWKAAQAVVETARVHALALAEGVEQPT